MFERILVFMLVALLGVVCLLAYEVYVDAKEWPAYRDAHNCVETGDWRSETVLMPMMAGKVSMLVPNTVVKSEWRCDSGTVWR